LKEEDSASSPDRGVEPAVVVAVVAVAVVVAVVVSLIISSSFAMSLLELLPSSFVVVFAMTLEVLDAWIGWWRWRWMVRGRILSLNACALCDPFFDYWCDIVSNYLVYCIIKT
jgi:protein-S-isoprenylcysteine O-methyltransferase Ste14